MPNALCTLECFVGSHFYWSNVGVGIEGSHWRHHSGNCMNSCFCPASWQNLRLPGQEWQSKLAWSQAIKLTKLEGWSSGSMGAYQCPRASSRLDKNDASKHPACLLWVRFQGHFFVLRHVECSFLVKQEVMNNFLASNMPKENQAQCNWGQYGWFPVFCWWHANPSSRWEHKWWVNEDSIQIYLNITTLINLNAFGVAGMNVLIYLLTSDHVY
jgi:hypothetical protein